LLPRQTPSPPIPPNVDGGDFVVIINAEKVAVSANKREQVKLYRHSGFPGGLRADVLGDMLKSNSPYVVEKAVKGHAPAHPPRQQHDRTAQGLRRFRASARCTKTRSLRDEAGGSVMSEEKNIDETVAEDAAVEAAAQEAAEELTADITVENIEAEVEPAPVSGPVQAVGRRKQAIVRVTMTRAPASLIATDAASKTTSRTRFISSSSSPRWYLLTAKNSSTSRLFWVAVDPPDRLAQCV